MVAAGRYPALRVDCSVQIQFAAGLWKTEATDRDGRARYGGGTMTKDGHEFYFGEARPYRGGTTVAVAHNLSMLDAEFAMPPEQIQEFRVQSRRFERAEIKDIALQPRQAGKPTSGTKTPSP